VIDTEVLIVGGGPAGSSCAWSLRRQGVECLVLDRVAFPRLKLCAGWITPEVVDDLQMEVSGYPHRFLSFERIRFHTPWLSVSVPTLQHSIRRYEFDDWLLRRSGAEVQVHEVRDIRPEGGGYVVDGAYRCRYLVGAGGTRCPVFRALFREGNPRTKALQAVTLEEEFPYRYTDPRCHLWFFEKGLPGYSWYVPKADGYLNVGIGGMAARLKSRGEDIKPHWARLAARLTDQGLVTDHEFKPKGYSYFVRGPGCRARIRNAFVVGDALGLATRDLCEGIGPAVRSGLLAARSIAGGQDYDLESIPAYSSRSRLVARYIDHRLHG